MPRNVSGTYTLPLPPVVPNTVIQAAWANTTDDDIAQGITDSLDRQGRGGMIAPFRLVDGSIASPALSFNAETGTGLSRPSAGVLAVSIMGVKVGQFSSTGLSTLVAGLFPDGTVAAPSISFTSDSDTGFYKPGTSNLSVGVDGRRIAYFDTRMVVEANTTASAPSLVVNAGNNAGGAGFAIDILGSGIGTDQAIFRMLNQGYSAVRFQLLADSAGAVMGTPGALPLSFVTSNTSRLVIAATGEARFSGALVAGPNFLVAETAAGAGTVGVPSGVGSNIVFWGNTSAGSGNMSISTGSSLAINIPRVANAVNYFEMQQSATGASLEIHYTGTDAAVGVNSVTKGAGNYNWYGHLGAATPQFSIQTVAGSTRCVYVAGSATDPILNVTGGRLNVAAPAIFTSASAPLSGVTTNYTYAYSGALGMVATSFANNDDRGFEWYRDNTGLYGRFMKADYSNATTWLQVEGGFFSGVGSQNFFLANPGAGGAYLTMRIARPGVSLGYVGIGQTTNIYTQLQAAGDGQNSAAVFDGGLQGSTLNLWDTFAPVTVGGGGCIKFAAGTNGSIHFAAIKGKITNASGNTTGDLVITTKDTTADTGSVQALFVGGDKTIRDNRNLSLMKDPGATAGSTPPIGSIIFATVGAGAVPALGSVNAATFNLTIQGTGAAANATVTAGTWRNCGGRDVSVGHALWTRIA